jgi:hypothetical protein
LDVTSTTAPKTPGADAVSTAFSSRLKKEVLMLVEPISSSTFAGCSKTHSGNFSSLKTNALNVSRASTMARSRTSAGSGAALSAAWPRVKPVETSSAKIGKKVRLLNARISIDWTPIMEPAGRMAGRFPQEVPQFIVGHWWDKQIRQAAVSPL